MNCNSSLHRVSTSDLIGHFSHSGWRCGGVLVTGWWHSLCSDDHSLLAMEEEKGDEKYNSIQVCFSNIIIIAPLTYQWQVMMLVYFKMFFTFSPGLNGIEGFDEARLGADYSKWVLTIDSVHQHH